MALKTCKRSLPFLLILFCVSDSSAQVFPELKARFESNKVFAADFSHTYFDSYTNETMSSEGKIWVATNKYRLDSEEQLLIVDGNTSKVYDGNRNRVIISDYTEEDDDFAPSRMLNGVDSTYTITEEPGRNGDVVITMTTDDDFATFVKVEILVDKNANPLKITAYDFSENVITTIFENGSFLPVNETLFVLDYPENAEIVDTRY